MKTLAVGLLLMQICLVCQGIETSCKDVSVFWGDPASITCIFSEDINQTRSGDFKMYRYDLHSSGTEKEVLILDCFWGDEANCQTKEGYTFDRTVSNQLTVVIPQADETYQGKYICQVEPTNLANVNQCRLTLKAGIKTTEAVSDEEEDINVAAVVVPILVLIILGVVGVFAYKYRKRILTRFTFLPCWRTQEDDTPNVPKVKKGPEGYGQLQAESHPLLLNPLSASVPETDHHLNERAGGQQPKLEETLEDVETFVDSCQTVDEVAARFNERTASHDDTITTQSGKDAASNAVDIKEERNANSSQASSRDYGGSFHQTSTKTTEDSILPAPEPFADTLNHHKREETHLGNSQDVVDPDIDSVKASLQTPDPLKLPIQASGETEHNKTQTTEVNSEETHHANDGGIMNSEAPAAPVTENLKEEDTYNIANADALGELRELETEEASKTDEDHKDNEDDDGYSNDT